MILATSLWLFGVKILWAFFVWACVCVNFWTLAAALTDRRYVLQQTNNAANRTRAWQSVRDELVTFLFQLFLFGLRFWGIFWPPPDNVQFRYYWSIDGTIVTILQVLLAFNCCLDLRDRRRTVVQDRNHKH